MKRSVSSPIAFPVLDGAADDLVVDVGDVAHVGDIEAGGAQPALHHVEHQHEARMAEVAVVIDGDAAHVHAHPARLDRDEILLAAGEGVVYLQHAQKTAGMQLATPHLPRKHGTTAEINSAAASIVEVRVLLLECRANPTGARKYTTMHPLLRRTAVALSLLLAAAIVHADELQDINRMMKQGQLPQSLERVDKYLAGKPRDAQGRFLKGLILTEMNRPNEAIQVFLKLSEDYPQLPEPYNNLAVLYASQGQYEKARVALETAIRTHPSYATAHENLGDIYAKLASQAYDKALQLDSSNTGAKTKLAMIGELIGSGTRIAGAPARTEPVKTAQAAPVKVADEGKAAAAANPGSTGEPKADEPKKANRKPRNPRRPNRGPKPAAAMPKPMPSSKPCGAGPTPGPGRMYPATLRIMRRTSTPLKANRTPNGKKGANSA